jgi:hypothetical protein
MTHVPAAARGATEHGRCNGAHVLCYVGSYSLPSRFDLDSALALDIWRYAWATNGSVWWTG